MKKIFNFIAAATALVLTVSACSDVFAPAQSSTQPQVAGTVEIIISNVTDYSFDVTIAPKGSAAYYSYLVDNDEYSEGIDAASLYGVKYESIAQGNVKYGTGSESYSFTVETEPNTTYTVYAVAGSPEGNVGEVAYKTILTSDNGIPELEDYEFQENMIALIFNEEVVPVEGKKITATAYAKLYLTGAPVIATTEGEIKQNKDGVVIVQFEEIKVPGTFYIVSYEEGTFTDLVGNPCPALEAGSFTANLKETDENDAAKAAPGTLWAYLENEDFEFDTKDIEPAIKDYNSYIPFKSEQMLAKGVTNKVNVTIIHKEGAKTTTDDYALSGAPYYGVTSLYSLGVKLPVEPTRGDIINISIDKGAVYDIYGNANAACDLTDMIYSYGYTLEDIIGEYELAYDEYDPRYSSKTVIEKFVPDPENEDDAKYEEDGFNVVLSYWDGYAYNPQLDKIHGIFDLDAGTLFIPDGEIFTALNYGGTIYLACIAGASAPYDLTFNVPEPGVFSTTQVIELSAYTTSYSYAGYFAYYTNLVATRVQSGSAPAPGTTSVNPSRFSLSPNAAKSGATVRIRK